MNVNYITLHEGKANELKYKVKTDDGLAKLTGPIHFGPQDEYGFSCYEDGPILARFVRTPKGWRDIETDLTHWDPVMLGLYILERLGLKSPIRRSVTP